MTAAPIADLALAQANPGQDGKITKLLDYLTTQPGHLTAFSESPLAQSRLLANPSEMAGKAGEFMEGLHERTEAIEEIAAERQTLGTNAAMTSAASVAPGPASALPRPAASAGADDGGQIMTPSAIDALYQDAMAASAQLANFSVEMTLVNRTIGGSVSAVNNLLRGQ